MMTVLVEVTVCPRLLRGRRDARGDDTDQRPGAWSKGFHQPSRKSDRLRDGVSGAEGRPSRADQRRSASHAGMSDILKIVRRGAISVQRGCDGRDLHPMSAMRAGEKQTRQVRWGNVLVMHGALLVARPPNYAVPTSRPIYERVNENFSRRTMFVHPDLLSGLFAPMAPHQQTRYGEDGRCPIGDVHFGLGHHSSVPAKLDQSCEARSKLLRKRFSEMESEKTCDHNDHHDYSDDVENIHCCAPIEECRTRACRDAMKLFALRLGSSSATRQLDRASASLLALSASRRMLPTLMQTACWRNRCPDLKNSLPTAALSTPRRLAQNASAGAATAGSDHAPGSHHWPPRRMSSPPARSTRPVGLLGTGAHFGGRMRGQSRATDCR
jgi:hypothetical protein